MNQKIHGIVTAIALAGAPAMQAQSVFSDTFNYAVTNAFVAEGNWTTVIDTGDGIGSDAGSGLMWGNAGAGDASLEYDHPATLSAGEVITMDANLNRPWGGYLYGMRVILWNGIDVPSRTEVAGGSIDGGTAVGGALPQVSYTVTPADITAGLTRVIFKYGHDANWGETNDVDFAVNPPPSGWTWGNVVGGSWATPGDWTPAGPADLADESALINLLDITGDQTITLDGNFTIGTVRFADTAGADGNWILNPGTGGPLVLSAPVNGSPGVVVGNQTATVGAVLTGTEGMTKSGAGTLVLGAANTYTGGTLIDGGTVQIGHSSAIPSGAGNGDVTLGGILDLNDNSIGLNGLTGGGTVTNSGIGTPTLSVGDDDATTSFGGTIGDGNGVTSVTKLGAGTLTLTGNNTFSGSLTGSGGSLAVSGLLRNIDGLSVIGGNTVELGATNMFVAGHGTAVDDAMVLAADDATLYMNATMDSRIGNVSLANGAIWTIDRDLSAWDVLLTDTTLGAATVTVANTGGNTNPSTMDGGGGLHLGGVQNFDVDDVTGDANEDLVVTLQLDNGGSAGGIGGLNKLGSGTILLDGPNTYSGDTTVAGGAVVLGEFGNLSFVIGANGVNNKVTGAGAATLGGFFDLDLTGADATTGNSWTLVDTATKSFGATFGIFDFTEVADVHTFVDGGTTWTFAEATGVLTVVTSNDYDTWAVDNSYWTPGDPNSGPTEDFDGDGVVNEDEYAFGLDPTDGSSVNPISVTLDPVAGTFSYTRRDPILTSLSYTYEWSTDLAGWTAVVPAVADTVVPSGDNQTVTVDLTGAPGDPLSNATLFVRVVAAP